MKLILKIFPIFALIIITIIFFGKTLTGNEIFVTPDFGGNDILDAEYPAKFFLSEALKSKQLPLWNPYIAGGFPQLGTITGNFNPINLIIFSSVPMPLAFNISLALSFLIAGIFTYLFLRSIGLSRIPSLFAAITFSYSGFFVTQISHFVVVQTLSFLPLGLYLVEVFIQKKKVFLLPLLSIVFGLQILAGFYQIVLYSLIFIFTYSIFRIFYISEAGTRKWGLLLGICAAVIGSFALSAIQLLPSWELTQISNRKGGVDFEEIKRFPYQFKHLITFIWPYLLGDPRVGSYPRFSQNWGIFWESTGFVGILPIIFAFFAILKGLTKSKIILIFTILFVLSLLLMLGKNSPAILLYKIPPLSFFRVPSRWIVFFAFSLTVLSAIGLEILFKTIESKIKKTFAKTIIAGFILTVAVANILIFAKDYHLRANTQKWLAPPETAQFLQGDTSTFRIITLGNHIVHNEQFLDKGWLKAEEKYSIFRQALDPNWNVVFDINQVDSYSPVTFKRDFILSGAIQQFTGISEDKIINIDPLRNLLNIQNVKYFISPFKIAAEDIELVYRTNTQPEYYVYQNNSVFPRVYVVNNYQVIPLVTDTLKFLTSQKLKPNTVILEKNLGNRKFKEATSQAKITNYRNQTVEIETDMKEDGILVLSDSYYPGWKAYVDGRETEILAANINQRAIILEKGEHKVEFVFKPKSFITGAIISLTSVIFLILILLFLLVKDKLKTNGER